jgi:hypothetical protein
MRRRCRPAARRADSWNTLVVGLEQDWITSRLGTEVDDVVNTIATDPPTP